MVVLQRALSGEMLLARQDERQGELGFIMADRKTNVRTTGYLLPPSVDDWLPADYPARFVVYIVEQLDLSPLARQ